MKRGGAVNVYASRVLAWKAGKTDLELAVVEGVRPGAISEWRRRNGLRVNCARDRASIPNGQSDSICWNCARACGGCAWSDKLEPVPGWRTTPRGTGWDVAECPEFVEG